ncbi:MAG: hypothetical protein WCF20_07730 [Methylovirgula sp.]
MTSPEDFLKDQLPVRFWPVIPRTLRTAYAAIDDLVKDTPILQIESAVDNKGRLVSFGVDFALRRAIESGALPCDYRWRDFAKPTGRYLELRFSHSTASISQVADPERQPRNVVFRENGRLNTQGVFDLAEFDDEKRIVGAPHFLLVHGHQSLNFAHWGLPSATSRSRYTWLSRNLMRLPHEIESELPPPEDTDVDLDELNLLKEDIERWRKDNGED